MSKRIVSGVFLGLAPLSAMGQHPPDSPEGPPVRVKAMTCAPGHLPGQVQIPFGYHQTQWRAFPVAQVELPKPAPATPEPAPAKKMPEKKVEAPVPPPKPNMSGRFATPSNPLVQNDKDVVPVPHPASVGGRTAPRNERGFASLRPEPVAVEPQAPVVAVKTEPAPAPAPVATRRPAVDPGIRQARGDDEIMRPDWPKLPADKK